MGYLKITEKKENEKMVSLNVDMHIYANTIKLYYVVGSNVTNFFTNC